MLTICVKESSFESVGKDEGVMNLYSQAERELLVALDELFVEWRKRWDGHDGWFIRDGFYPGYLKMKKRVLFIGRDSYDQYNVSDEFDYGDYIATFIPQYLKGRTNCGSGDRCINRNRFHKLLIQIVYGLNAGKTPLPWNAVLPASEICRDGNVFGSASFAFMNLGKLSHESCDAVGVNADWIKINKSVAFSIAGENLIKKEINLLSPDIIIAMNWNDNPDRIDYRQLVLGEDLLETKISIADCGVYSFARADGRCVPFLDCWHFSGRFSEEQYLYRPIVMALEALENKTV